ncbi:MAG: thioredoxin-disulfide reductase [Bacillota bacterium]|nr:thioredoxin-disulfide reductase [Bacillota bacterium]
MAKATHDVIIVGAGPAGLSAGIYCGRANLRTGVIDKMGPGGQVATTDWVENYPGFPEGISGLDLSAKMEEQARRFGADIILAEIENLKEEDGLFTLCCTEGDLRAPAVIIASGARSRELGVPGESRFKGRGVSYCATCDGALYKEKVAVVVGGGDSAIGEAMFLTKFARKVHVVHRRGALRATEVLQDRAFKNSRLEFVWSSVVTSINGGDKVQSVTVRNVKDERTHEILTDGVFLYVGLLPNTEFIRGFVDLDEWGYVLTDDNMKASRLGVFAAGDVRHKEVRQVVTATADGAMAAVSVEHYLSETGKAGQ